MGKNHRTFDEVTEDVLLFELGITDKLLGNDYRIIGAVLPLNKAEIVPIAKPIPVELKPRYKALIAVCLCAGLLGTGALGLIAQTQNTVVQQCN